MSLRIPLERTSPLVLFLQAFRSVICGAFLLVVALSLIQSDPHQQHFLTVATALRDWIHAAFNL